NYFYLGEFYSHKNETERAFYYYGIALSKLDNPNQIKPELIGLSQDIFNKKQRTRLKIAVPIIHLKMGETEKFKEELNEAYYFADQFYQERELLHILILQAEYDYKYAKTNQDYWRSLNRLNKATEILKNNPGLFLEINESSIGYLFKLKNYNNIKLKNYKNLSKDREALFSAIFFRQLVTNQFHFREKKTTELLNQLKYSIRKDRNYIKKMEDALTLGLQIQRVEKAKKENYLDFQRIAKDFQDSTPLKINILSWINPPDTKITNLNTDETFVEIYKSDNKVLLLLDNEKVSKNKEFSIQEGESLEIRLGYELENILKNFPNTKSLAISPPPSLHSFNFFQIQYKNKNLNESFPLRFIPRRGALSPIESPGTILKRITSIDTTEIEKSKKDEFLFNPMEFILSPFTTPKKIKSDLNFRIIPTYQTRSFIDDSNVIEGPTDFTNRKQFLGESRYGYLTIKDIVEEQNYVEVVVLNNYQPNRDNYMKVSFLLDILQMSGVNSLLLIPGSEDSEKKRNELLLNINQASTIAQKEQIFIFGKPIIKRNTKSQESNLDEITVLNKKAILLEREEKWTESLRYLLQANSLIDRQDQDIQISQEIHIARIKSKKRTNNIMDPFLFLLDEFEKSGKARKDVLLNATIHCYIYSKPQDCEKYYNAFLKENTSSKDESKILDFYRNLAIGNKYYIYENYSEFIKLTKIKDPLLYHIDLGKMFLKQFMWKYANDHIELANNEARTKSEQSIALKIKSQLQWEKYFITGKFNKDLSFNSDRLYSRAINKDWNALETELEKELNSTENYFRKNYLKRIYSSYKKLRSESDFEPINLGPLYLKDGSSSQILLDEAERSFLFFTLTSSIPYQKGKELNNNFDILHKSEISQGNTNRANWMLIEWASYLYYNGDKENAKNYFQKFEKNFKYSKEEIVGVYSNLKYKLSLNFNDIKITKEDLNIFKQTNPEWQKDYTLTSQLEKSSEFMPFIINSIQSKNVELDDYTNRQIFDLIEILMKKSLSSKDNATFIELGFLKEKIRSYNTKTLGKIPSTGQLNLKWKPIVQGLVQKLPQDQSIKGILDLGVESYSFTIENKKIDIQPAISDNRIVKFDNYRYLYSIKNEGGTIAQQKVLEKKYRNILKFNNLQITYLYLPSYHFKVTIKPRRLDRFVYFLNPDQLLENPIYNSAKDFQGDFPIKNMNISTRNDLAWKKKLDLESMEINYRNGLANTKPFIVSAEDLELSMGKQIKFGGRDLQSVKFIPVRNGCWIHTGSLLVNTSLKTDDMAHSLYFWDRLHYGPGIVNVADSTDTHVAYFLKEFLTKKYNDRNYHERYYLAYESLKNNWKEDRYWNGWKTYTNTFIMDKNP
ncbi:MAG: hypothetical protein JJT78_12215, partial [Leptospira sp.]|nr:hypothetical protein [Leptospira sp.]